MIKLQEYFYYYQENIRTLTDDNHCDSYCCMQKFWLIS